MTKTLNGRQWKSMAASGAAMLDSNKETLNALNIFPVPDGDTGTNMCMTAAAAAREVAQIEDPDPDLEKILSAMSSGALRGARGNSGVILSQLMAGFTHGLKGKQSEYDVESFVRGIEKGTELAYNAVMRPKEGTILTVAAEVAKAAREYADKYDDFEGLLDYINKKGMDAVQRTQDMLPVLKEAGVVDAGGAGLMAVLSGFQAALEGRELDASALLQAERPKEFTDVGACDREIEYGYCTEFFIRNLYPQVHTRDINKFRDKLSTIGDCVIVVGDTDLVKVHVHTNTPGTALNSALQLGELSSVKIDNMREQHRELNDGAAYDGPPAADVAVTVVANGDGFTSVFEDCQIKSFVNGGQSLNPSADEIARAIRATRAKHVIVLPNNKNIVLAAEQAAKLVDQDVTVIKTTTLPEGVAAAIAFDPEASAEDNVKKMQAASEAVWSGQVTHAVRDALFKGAEVRRGEIIGLHDGKIVSSGHRFESVVVKLLADIPEEAELVTIYHGSDVKPEDAERVREEAAKALPDIDIDLLYGGQPVYDYIVSAE